MSKLSLASVFVAVMAMVSVSAQTVQRYHSADVNKNNTMELSELLRVVQFFNQHGYHASDGTEDGFAPGLVSEPTDPQPEGETVEPTFEGEEIVDETCLDSQDLMAFMPDVAGSPGQVVEVEVRLNKPSCLIAGCNLVINQANLEFVSGEVLGYLNESSNICSVGGLTYVAAAAAEAHRIDDVFIKLHYRLPAEVVVLPSYCFLSFQGGWQENYLFDERGYVIPGGFSAGSPTLVAIR